MVSVVVLNGVYPGGVSSTPIWSYSEPYDTELGATSEEAARVTGAATREFALRLRRLLA